MEAMSCLALLAAHDEEHAEAAHGIERAGQPAMSPPDGEETAPAFGSSEFLSV